MKQRQTNRRSRILLVIRVLAILLVSLLSRLGLAERGEICPRNIELENPYHIVWVTNSRLDQRSSSRTETDTQTDSMAEANGTRTYSNIKHTILVLSGKGGNIHPGRYSDLFVRGRQIFSHAPTRIDIIPPRVPRRSPRHRSNRTINAPHARSRRSTHPPIFHRLDPRLPRLPTTIDRINRTTMLHVHWFPASRSRGQCCLERTQEGKYDRPVCRGCCMG